MHKPDALRAAIVAAQPWFGADPDRLKIWIDAGRMVSCRTAALGFEYRYSLQILAEAVTIGPDALLVPILLWLRDHQPDLFLRFRDDDGALMFSADILDDSSWTIAIVLDLTEAVTITPRPDGSGWDLDHLPEPSPDDPLLPGASRDQPLAALLAGGSRVL